ncbi:CLUMA_CG014542, isoform A [Clunio marinus]|uniref:CLUMA_CG014542, isoform A n=1 Tax=Clunio marinus TaxID=568069 RepID=A0A1J1ILN7_9DIPT|nr:CLUMA_CG014542, isoform A [Clunio marinus]
MGSFNIIHMNRNKLKEGEVGKSRKPSNRKANKKLHNKSRMHIHEGKSYRLRHISVCLNSFFQFLYVHRFRLLPDENADRLSGSILTSYRVENHRENLTLTILGMFDCEIKITGSMNKIYRNTSLRIYNVESLSFESSMGPSTIYWDILIEVMS